MSNPCYYAILPANVRYDKNLKPMEKILYAEITALSNKDGYCSASNSYFAKLYEKSPETISRWISHLEKEGYLIVKIDTSKGNLRKIYPIDKKINTIDENINTLLTKKSRPIDENVKQNNINSILQDSIIQENKEKEKNIKKEKSEEKSLFERAKSDLSVQEKLKALGVDEDFLFELISYREEIKASLKTIMGVIGQLKQFAEVKALAKVGPYEALQTMRENEWKTPKAIKNIYKVQNSNEFSLKELEKFGFKFDNDEIIEAKVLEGGSNEQN